MSGPLRLLGSRRPDGDHRSHCEPRRGRASSTLGLVRAATDPATAAPCSIDLTRRAGDGSRRRRRPRRGRVQPRAAALSAEDRAQLAALLPRLDRAPCASRLAVAVLERRLAPLRLGERERPRADAVVELVLDLVDGRRARVGLRPEVARVGRVAAQLEADQVVLLERRRRAAQAVLRAAAAA